MIRFPSLALSGVLAASLVVSAAFHAQSTHAADMTRHRDMLYVTVVRSATERAIPVNAYYAQTPDKGNVFVTLWLRAQNHNDVPLALEASAFTLLTPDGRVRDHGYETPAPDLGTEAVLDVAGRASGTLTFEVPAGTHHGTLRWAPAPQSYAVQWASVTWPLAF